ncbi:hypothetical protein Ancab_003266 [Ancistrocladus abbreviatus]
MKAIKAMKKRLKFWSRKKKKKKINDDDKLTPFLPPPPPPCHCHLCHPHSFIQPSAPPLPSWLEVDLPPENVSASGFNSISGASGQADPVIASEEIVAETCSQPCPTLSPSFSYQQYMVVNPVVYGVPCVPPPPPPLPPPRRQRAAGFFGCVVTVGMQMIRCFFPCFRIREDVY